MDTDPQAQLAIQGLHDLEHEGRWLIVSEAKPREDRVAVVALMAVIALAAVEAMEVVTVASMHFRGVPFLLEIESVPRVVSL